MISTLKISRAKNPLGRPGAVPGRFGTKLRSVAVHQPNRKRGLPTAAVASAKGMFLILHGAEDEAYPLTTVDQVIQELRAAKAPFQLEVYSGTGHGFSTPKNQAEERANTQSIASTTRTLKEMFGI
jgi:dienelactone hydrolase